MMEYSSVSASSYDIPTLVARVNERAAEGWRVVSVVAAGADAVALLERERSADAPVTAQAAAAVVAAEPVAEPAGWAIDPTPAATPAPVTSTSTWGESVASTPAAVVEPVVQPVAPVVQPAAPVTPTVPAGWYPDPSGRFEQRYWDGTQWTEHVARQGQQYTDPPVA
jgi:hypothetical protein